jgi:hypothetical protein
MKGRASEEEMQGYHVHPLDEFDRFMLARVERGPRRREEMRPVRAMDRIAYKGRGRREPYGEEAELERRYYGPGERMRKRYIEEEGEGEEEEGIGYSDDYSEEEGEGLMSAPEELDQDEEYITGRRMPIRRRGVRPAQYELPPRRVKRRRDQSEEEEEDQGLEFTVYAEDQDEGMRRERGRPGLRERKRTTGEPRLLPERSTRHPSYEDMIAEAIVKVGKSGKASGIAIFKYINDHFDMPANDRLVRNHLHQAFERLIGEGKLRHKKASYVIPRNLIKDYEDRFAPRENEEEGEVQGKEEEKNATRKQPSKKAKTTDAASA